MKKVFPAFLFFLFSLAIFSCNNEASKVDNNEPKSAEVAQDSSQKEAATKPAEKTLLGKWYVIDMDNEKIEKGAMIIEFNADGKVSMLNQEDNSAADYELIEEENLIKVTNSDDAPETWTIEKWEDKTLAITAKSPDGEEALLTLER